MFQMALNISSQVAKNHTTNSHNILKNVYGPGLRFKELILRYYQVFFIIFGKLKK